MPTLSSILCFPFMASSSIISLFFFTILTFMDMSSSTILFPLTNSLSKSQFNTTHHLLKSTATNSLLRHHHRRKTRNQISLPLSPGTDYTLSLSLSSQPITLYMDTGSDLVWFPCSPFECVLCEGEYDPSLIKNTVFNLSKLASSVSAVSCQSSYCSSVHSGVPNSDLCAMAKCYLDDIEVGDCEAVGCPNFYYAYADGSFVARLYRDRLEIEVSAPPKVLLRNFTFGCAHTALAEPVGVAGFGRGVLSMPAQLANFAPHLGNQFSYCLVSHSFNANRVRIQSPLILGRRDPTDDEEETEIVQSNKAKEVRNTGGFVYTTMLENPKHPYFYLVGLEGITVGKTKIPAPKTMMRVDLNGNGGMVVDSGTTYTILPMTFYTSVVNEFDHRLRKVNKRASEVEDKTGLGPCYYFDESANQTFGSVPDVALHFVGAGSSVVLPRRNYFYDFLDGGDGVGKKRKVGCLMLMTGGDEKEGSGPSTTLGNYQQQGFEVVYDLENKRVGFAKRKCASLWDTLNKR